ncbi:uncharacterized protein LOC124353990 [Homalodisca vitripennis]|nr:uncharacterized protein LOC124353990 [Homalodisca vitripennis]XP_046660052.1 uncharacterized protein LOC124353990 [Homalodisca vitripennis]
MVIPATLGLLVTCFIIHVAAGECPGEKPTKHLLCYLEEIPARFDPCLCTHIVLQTSLEKLTPQSELVKAAHRLQETNPSLKLILQASESAEVALKRRGGYARAVSGAVSKCGLDGVEVALRWGKQTAGKVQLADFVQTLSKEFDKLEPKERSKRSYKIHENIADDVVTPRWTPQGNSKKIVRKAREVESSENSEKSTVTDDETTEVQRETSSSQEIIEEEEIPENGKQIILHLTSEPQYLAKNFDLKRLSKYVSLYTLASDNLTDSSERGLAYHPSRLMGIEDILNADSLVDLVTGLGAPHDKLVLTLPATALKFTLADKEKNLPQSPVTGEPVKISRAELCTLMAEGEWTVERDEDLTAPYAFHDTNWLAFDDPTSVSIKGKYILLRDLAGAAVRSADAEDWMAKCNSTGPVLLQTLHDTFTHIARKSRAAQLVSLQEQLHEAGQFSYSGDVHLSPYRIVRVVDRAGSIHVVRKEAKTEFECSRQGYFRHPSGCNRFYRCVKFNQYTPDFTVFEYDCPAGLAFDETVEVCVWPGSLADGGACQGSSEIAPVPRSRYVCPQVAGYYADPENCRWFFACLDHQGDGSPLTAYEFRCPFGLVFDEQALVCNWPWLVPGCGGAGVYRARFTVGDFYEGRHRPSYASLSDVHVSGGRIENVAGGVVLDSAIRGIGSGAYLGSGGSYDGSNILGAGAYSGTAGGAYGGVVGGGGVGSGSGAYVAGGAGPAFVSELGAGGLASGTYQSNTVVGSGTGSGHSSGSTDGAYLVGGSGGSGYSAGSGAYSAGAGNAGTVYTSGGNAGVYSAGAGNAGTVYTSGSNAGAYSAGAGNAGTVYTSGGNAGAYSAGAGNAGTVYTSGGNAGVYSAGAGNAGTVYTSGGNAGAYSAGAGNAGTVYTSGGSAGTYSTGTGNAGTVYSDGSNAGTYNAQNGKYSGSYSGAGGYRGGIYNAGSSGSSSTRYGGAGFYGSYGNGAYISGGDYAGAYIEDNSGAYIHDNSGDYIHDNSGDYRGDLSGLYTGKESYGGQYTGNYVGGGAYIHGIYDNGAYSGSSSSGGKYKGNYVGGGEYSGTYDTGAYRGSGSTGGQYKGEYDAGSYSGKYDTGSYSGKYDTGAYSGKYDGGSYSGQYDGGAYSGKYDGGAYTGESDSGAYHGESYYSGGASYQGGYGAKVKTVPTTVVTDGGYGTHEINNLNIVEHKPAVGLVGLDAVRVSGGDSLSGGYVSSYVTPAPLPAVSVTPAAPVVSSYSTVTPAPISVSTYTASTRQPTTPRPVTYYPLPSSPVTPVPSKPLISYSTVKPPVFVETYKQPSYVKTVTPAPAVYTPTVGVIKTPVVPVSPVTYTYKQPVVKSEFISTGYQYSTPTPFSGVSYERPSFVKTVTPPPATYVQPVEVKYSYPKPAVFKTPIVPLNPIQYSTPAPIEYPVAPLKPVSYATPAPIPQIKTSYTPAVFKTPVVPLNPVQYSTPAPVLFEHSTPSVNTISYSSSYSTPAPPVYQTPAPIRPLRPITYTTPAPPVSFEYSTPAPPVVKPILPLVAKTPVVPLNPVQYSTPAPPVVDFSYSVAAPIRPIKPVVFKTPVVPLHPVQYSTPAPYVPVRPLKPITYKAPSPVVNYEYLPPAPVQPLKPLRPITYTTPAPVLSYEYSAPLKPVVPAVLKTPVVPLNPIQYSTPAPVPVKPYTYTTPAPAFNYEYNRPASIQPLKPVTYTAPAKPVSIPLAPLEPLKPLRPITYSTPAPAVSYEYLPPAPVQPLKPLRPITYTTPAPDVNYEYLSPAPVKPLKPLRPLTYTTPAPEVNYEYLPPAPVKPLKPLRPITYTTPAPVVSYEYSTPIKPVVPAVFKTPVVPLNPIQYTTSSPVSFEYSTPAPVRVKPLRPVTYTTAAPSIQYLPPVVQPVQPLKPVTLSTPAPFSYDFKYQSVKPVPTVFKTPVVPLNPVQYTPAPPVVQYSTPAPIHSISYVKPLKPVTYSTPAPPVSYEYSTPAPSPVPVTFEYKTPSYVKPIPTVLKTPVVPLNPVQYSTPAPIINQYSFGVAYQRPEIQYEPEGFVKQSGFVKSQVVQEGYNYRKPSVKFVEGPKLVTTPAPTVTYSTTPEPVTPIYKQVYNFVKAPMVSAYEKVLNAISYSSTPTPLPAQPVTQSPVSFAPVTVGPSYSRPALVKTPSIPVTPVAVVPEYQKVLNVVKATTTPAPLYVNHYANSYEQELLPVSTPRPVIFKQTPVLTETYNKDYSYEENVDDLYDSLKSDFGTRLTGEYEQKYVYNQENEQVPQVKLVTPAVPVTIVKEPVKVRRPIKTHVQQPVVAVGYDAGSYEGGSVYSTTPAPVFVSSSEGAFGEQFHKETAFTGYTGHAGDSVSFEEVVQPIPVVTSTTQAPTVKVTTARVSLPVVPVRPEGGYYLRRQKVRVRPVSTTTFAPTYSYSTTPVPAVTFSTTGHPDDEVDVEEEEEDVKLLQEYNGQYGGVVSKGGYSVSSTVASIQDGEAIVGVLKKGRVTYDGRRTKSKVIVVSKLSDFNPLLVGKLGAECSCDSKSNTVTVRNRQRGSSTLFTPSRDSTIPDQQLVDTYLTSTSTFAPVVVGGSSSYESSYESSSYDSPVVEIRPLRKKVRVYSTTTSVPEYPENFVVSEEPTFLPAGADRVKADSVQCNRAGLFRHPNKCNKFYSCNWDQWKKKFTLHEFKCPIHLAYDTNLGACNWPSKGPACAEDNLLV